MSNQELWDQTIAYYEMCVSEGQDLQPLLSLVKQIAATDYAEEFYPVVSLMRLCISMAKTWEDVDKLPMVTVQYMGNQSFRVWFRGVHSQFRKNPDYEGKPGEIWTLLEALFIRLNAETESVRK